MLMTFSDTGATPGEPRFSPALRFALALLAALLLALSLLAQPALAKPAFSALVVDARTGEIVFSRNADARRYPASLTKMMTLYLVFEDIKAGRISLSTPLKASKHSASRPPSKVGLKPGQTITVKDAIGALVTKSANDVAATVAENLSGSVSAFAERMTSRARAIGMTRTTFRNPSGLPDSSQVTTARDMATLGLRLQRDFPNYFDYFAMRSYKYKGRNYRNHNRLLGRLKGIDGIKTGYTRASGFNLVSSVERGGKRVVGVVIGGRSGGSRNRYMASMIEKAFKGRKLSSGRTIAAVAGSPPGFDAARVTATAQEAPVTPRRKPAGKAEEPAQQQAALAALVSKEAAGDAFKAVVVAGKANETVIEKIEDAPEQPADDAPDNDTWNIQIGAFPTREGAENRIETAMEKAGNVLNGKTAFTMVVDQEGAKLYRARISGFDRRSADKTCKLLTKKGFGCFALAPRG